MEFVSPASLTLSYMRVWIGLTKNAYHENIIALNIVFQKRYIKFKDLNLNPYPANIFCHENVVCFLHLLHIFICFAGNVYC